MPTRRPPPAPEIVDLAGALVTPAFVDAHAHLSATGAALRGVDLSGARSLNEAVSRIETGVRRTGGRPVMALGWDESAWPERRPFTARELDRAAYGGVVFASRVDGHSAVISSALAAAARLAPSDHDVRTRTGRRPPPRPGGLRRDRHPRPEPRRRRGSPAAGRRAGDRRGPRERRTGDQRRRGPRRRPRRRGPSRPARGWCPTGPSWWTPPTQARRLVEQHGAHGLAGDLNVDGSIGSRTASLRVDYLDAPGNRGQAFLTVAQVRDHVAACTRAGVQAGFHVIGDAGVDTVLAGFEAAAELVGATGGAGRPPPPRARGDDRAPGRRPAGPARGRREHAAGVRRGVGRTARHVCGTAGRSARGRHEPATRDARRRGGPGPRARTRRSRRSLPGRRCAPRCTTTTRLSG